MSSTVRTPARDAATKTKKKVERPKLYRVLLHNDHYTTMDFVVHVLQGVFSKNAEEAVRIMLDVHQSGVGVAGIYPSAIAEAKVSKVGVMAQAEGFPLKCSAEPE